MLDTIRVNRLPEGVLSAIGHSPTVRLARLGASSSSSFYAKLEFLNPGGSMKDRPALAMLQRALADGTLERGGLVVESSSGNMGIGLAQAARCLGLRFICVIDTKTTTSNMRILKALGAELEVVTEPHPETGEFLDARKHRVDQLLARNPGAFWPDQYRNPANTEAHRATTAPELLEALGGAPDYVLIATSTCGTLGGFQQFFKSIGAHTQLVAVDAEGSALFGPPSPGRIIPGLGSASKAQFVALDELHIDYVNTRDCVVGCHLLAQREAMLAGGSAGGVVTAALRLARRVPGGSHIAMVLPDRGERYLDTVFNDEWLAKQSIDLDEGLQEFS
jgi:2,3-diaminopropionate biosynthesis protein SbnA